MRLKVLAEDSFQIVGCMDGEHCEAEDFLLDGQEAYRGSREGLLQLIEHFAKEGLQNAPSKLVHEANKKHQIYEFIKGDLRLFFFKGKGRQIAVCSGGAVKKGGKADKGAVNRAIDLKATYAAAFENKTIEVVQDEAE